ncbi:MAG: hypothetical protein IJH12_01545 [Clostridia bacterium]|nr:hypothetical protein [Clostridia bacterium]
MFEDFIGKKVTLYLMSNPEDTYVITGTIITSNELSTIIEVEERKKFGEIKRIKRAINNRYITFIDLLEETVRSQKQVKFPKTIKEDNENTQNTHNEEKNEEENTTIEDVKNEENNNAKED